MNAQEAEAVAEALSGYWPASQMELEEVKAWAAELTRRPMNVSLEEATVWLNSEVRSGRTWRPRPGEMVAGVQGLRRKRRQDVSAPALPWVDECLTGDALTEKLAEVRGLLAAGRR